MRQDDAKRQDDLARNMGKILTAEDRAKWIEGLKRGPASREHIERLKLIYKPFPAIRFIGGGGSAATWAGTIVTDTFFGTAVRDTFFGTAVRKATGRELVGDGSYRGKYADVEALL